MTLLAAERISKRFDDLVLFNDVSFTVNEGDRIGLVGRNGSGKTTLFELMAGLQEIDSGTVTRARKCKIDYAEQEKTEYMEISLFDYVASARQDLLDMRHEIAELQDHLASHPADRASLTRMGQLQNRYEAEKGFGFENEIKTILAGLSFPEDRHRDQIRNFSGGEKNRAGLARVLAGNSTLMLLDEPTNHLDIESTCWLEEYLGKTDRAYIVVSHDRTFLQNTISCVWNIQSSGIDFYAGSFEKFLSQRAERRRLQEHRYKHQQEEIRRIEDFIRRNMAGQKTKQAQSRLKYLQRIKRLPPPKSDGSSPNISMKSSGRSYAHVLAVNDVAVGYGSTTIVRDMNFDLYRGDKIGMIGPNGSGKSTILKSLIGELAPIHGEIRLGNNLDVAYFDQELSELDSERTVLENLWEMDPSAEVGIIRSFLGRFGFTGDESLKKVSTLSGGEKTKLSLARLLYHPANFIIFDEPTNHLDLGSREVLEQALIDYEGSTLIVSHDRYFLDRVVNKILHVHDGIVDIYAGNYSYFKEKTGQVAVEVPVKPQSSKQAYLKFKEKSRSRARLKKEIQSTKDKIASTEREIENLTEAINHEIPRSDWEKLAEATQKRADLEEKVLTLIHRLEVLEEIELD
ncbi:MAG: ABC-F family ATP-binding cassette domain-containing protein [Candidatus Zixiibacteriota bacterium]|nr:MAG: ABC-F family ATP-binding cassette domain-containing protein [candidate division Zixibacteria bacterium]